MTIRFYKSYMLNIDLFCFQTFVLFVWKNFLLNIFSIVFLYPLNSPILLSCLALYSKLRSSREIISSMPQSTILFHTKRAFRIPYFIYSLVWISFVYFLLCLPSSYFLMLMYLSESFFVLKCLFAYKCSFRK